MAATFGIPPASVRVGSSAASNREKSSRSALANARVVRPVLARRPPLEQTQKFRTEAKDVPGTVSQSEPRGEEGEDTKRRGGSAGEGVVVVGGEMGTSGSRELEHALVTPTSLVPGRGGSCHGNRDSLVIRPNASIAWPRRWRFGWTRRSAVARRPPARTGLDEGPALGVAEVQRHEVGHPASRGGVVLGCARGGEAMSAGYSAASSASGQ